MLVKALLIWVGLVVVAVLNGGVRNAILAPRFGELAGHVISTGILCGLIFFVAWLTIPWLGPRGALQALLIGAVWMFLTITFEFLAGHYLFGHSWTRLLADYNLVRGPSGSWSRWQVSWRRFGHFRVEGDDMAAIRYLVSDVERAIAFYTQHLGFKLERHMAPAFASVSRGDLTLWLSGPQSSGARPMPDGRRPEPGGWNRLVLEVEDLLSVAATMKHAGMRFRNEILTGPGGKQILLEDPDGNPIELFEPAR